KCNIGAFGLQLKVPILFRTAILSSTTGSGEFYYTTDATGVNYKCNIGAFGLQLKVPILFRTAILSSTTGSGEFYFTILKMQQE
ncbi:MAG: hypothetical protein ACK55Z_15800, partial [bacterium]